jgi:hypothetical protein
MVLSIIHNQNKRYMANSRSRTEILRHILETAYEIMISAPLEKIFFRRLFVVGVITTIFLSGEAKLEGDSYNQASTFGGGAVVPHQSK